jgi:hypothetical protein
MLGVGSLFILSALSFVLYAVLVTYEERSRQRLVLAQTRSFLDKTVTQVDVYIRQKVHFLIRHTIKLSWYYSIHSTLRAVMTVLVRMYDSLESLFMKNRERARTLRAERRAMTEKSHLEVIGEHKASIALTTSQKKKLMARKLERE